MTTFSVWMLTRRISSTVMLTLMVVMMSMVDGDAADDHDNCWTSMMVMRTMMVMMMMLECDDGDDHDKGQTLHIVRAELRTKPIATNMACLAVSIAYGVPLHQDWK